MSFGHFVKMAVLHPKTPRSVGFERKFWGFERKFWGFERKFLGLGAGGGFERKKGVLNENHGPRFFCFFFFFFSSRRKAGEPHFRARPRRTSVFADQICDRFRQKFAKRPTKRPERKKSF